LGFLPPRRLAFRIPAATGAVAARQAADNKRAAAQPSTTNAAARVNAAADLGQPQHVATDNHTAMNGRGESAECLKPARVT
jgi:hypothetical protein